MASNFASFAI